MDIGNGKESQKRGRRVAGGQVIAWRHDILALHGGKRTAIPPDTVAFRVVFRNILKILWFNRLRKILAQLNRLLERCVNVGTDRVTRGHWCIVTAASTSIGQ